MINPLRTLTEVCLMFAARSTVAIFLSVLLSSICFRVPAQSRPADVPPRFVSAAEGEAIVQAAWELRRGLNPKPDCSHFVQAVYARAGFFYDYASSREIFAGVSGFRRVRKAQPGDLVVWQGHMGIVIDPREHSFYSSVLSGFAIENYQSNYWSTRGSPRFYRFVVNVWPDAPWPDPSNLAQVGLASNEVLLRVIQPSPASGKSPALMATARPRASGLQPARVEAEAKAKANVSRQIKTQASALTNANAQTRANAQTKASAPSPITAEPSVQIQAPASAQMKPEASGQLKVEAKANVSRQFKTQAPAQTKASAPSPISAEPSVQIRAPASAQMKPEASGQLKVEAKANVSPQIKAQASAQAKPSAPSPITAAGSVQIQAPASAQMKPEASGQMKAEASGQMKVDATHNATKNAEIHDEVLVTSRPIPSRSEVLDAINRSADYNGERLLQNGRLDSQPSVGVVDSFTIVSLDFQGNVGLVDLEIKEIAAFRYGTARPYRLTALKRVILSRQEKGWILLDPQNLVYLNRRVAAKTLSHQLASMPQGPAGQQQVRIATKILHELMSADAGGSD